MPCRGTLKRTAQVSRTVAGTICRRKQIGCGGGKRKRGGWEVEAAVQHLSEARGKELGRGELGSGSSVRNQRLTANGENKSAPFGEIHHFEKKRGKNIQGKKERDAPANSRQPLCLSAARRDVDVGTATCPLEPH